MAVLDKALEFSDAQSLASKSSGVTTKSTNVVDTRSNATYSGWKFLLGSSALLGTQDLGGSVWNVNVNTILVGAGAAVRADLVSKASASISSGATVIASVTFPAVSAAGTKKSIRLTPGTTALRYLGVNYTAVGAKLTSAKFDSFLNLGNEKYD